MTETIHVPVMMSESIESLDLKSGDIVVDHHGTITYLSYYH
jgi:16S rRNA C1402 N4-methylase RsmH